MKKARGNSRRGFMILDVITGLFLFAIFGSVLAIALAAQARGASRMSESRTALRAAESALLQLQSGVRSPLATDGATIEVRDEAGVESPRGSRWVSVRASFHGRSATISGVVSEGSR